MLAQTKVEKCPCCAEYQHCQKRLYSHNNQRVLCKDCGKEPGAPAQEGHRCDPAQLRERFLERLSLSGSKPRVFHQLLPSVSSLESSVFTLARLQNSSEHLPTKASNPAI
jgi:hypothetical protein